MAFEHTIRSGAKLLRCGYTTGTCAALAAQGAARLLLGQTPKTAALQTPAGLAVQVQLEDVCVRPGRASCGVRKFAGDDIDVTVDALICASAEFCEAPGVSIEGGPGVGRVTKPGLDQPVGAAAINSVPRRMIARAVEEVLQDACCEKGVRITIWVPQGEALAAKTFNPQLGIRGGISILGTSGIVKPQSVQALVDSIELEIRQRAAEGAKTLLLTPGNYGCDYIAAHADLAALPLVVCSNYIGEALDACAVRSIADVVLVGHIGKLVKLAGGIFNTHSRVADCRAELFCAHAALCGADRALCAALMNAATADACLELLAAAGLRAAVVQSLLNAMQERLGRRAAPGQRLGAVVFSNQSGFLGQTATAASILNVGEKP